MDPKLKRIIEEINHHKKTRHPWKRGEVVPQPYFIWQQQQWQAVDTDKEKQQKAADRPFSVLAWNIDFMRSFSQERMRAALAFLQKYVEQISNPCIIMFNEMMVSDLEIIQVQPWVRDGYHITDIDHKYWESGYYGTCVLLPKSLPIDQLFRVHYEDTAMERDGLFVDIGFQSAKVRICSTHLESLVADPPKRPSQLATAARYMKGADASILGGDLNAIQTFDKTLHSDNGLKDAYLELEGVEDAESGMTWGQMAAKKERNQFGLSRMDKLMFCGQVIVEHFETFGMDVVIEEEELGKQLVVSEGLEKPWVTDHLGVRGDFRIVISTSSKI